MITLLSTLAFAEEPAAAEEEVAPGWTLLVPFGVPQFVQHKPVAGGVYAGLQVIGLGVTGYSTVQMRKLAEAEDIDAELRFRMISAGAVAVASGAWFASVVHGSAEREKQLEALEASMETWSPPVAEAQW